MYGWTFDDQNFDLLDIRYHSKVEMIRTANQLTDKIEALMSCEDIIFPFYVCKYERTIDGRGIPFSTLIEHVSDASDSRDLVWYRPKLVDLLDVFVRFGLDRSMLRKIVNLENVNHHTHMVLRPNDFWDGYNKEGTKYNLRGLEEFIRAYSNNLFFESKRKIVNEIRLYQEERRQRAEKWKGKVNSKVL